MKDCENSLRDMKFIVKFIVKFLLKLNIYAKWESCHNLKKIKSLYFDYLSYALLLPDD